MRIFIGLGKGLPVGGRESSEPGESCFRTFKAHLFSLTKNLESSGLLEGRQDYERERGSS